jgi:hypothetical protein
MKNLKKRHLTILVVVFIAACYRQAPQSLIESLAQLRQQKRIAIGYIYDRKLSVLEPGGSAQIRDYTIAGPGFYADRLVCRGGSSGIARWN